MLHRVGEVSFRHPVRVIASWLVILTLLGVGASQVYEAPSSEITIPGTAAQQTIDELGDTFTDSDGATGRIVFHANDGSIADYREDITTMLSDVKQVSGVAGTTDPFSNATFISDDKTIAFSQVQLDEQTGSVDESTLSAVQEVIDENRSTELQIESGGDLVSVTPGQIIGTTELVGVAIALMVLVITFGSLIAGGMPIVTALIAVGITMAGLFSLSQVLDINSTTPVLAVMLGLAVGIDYSLFIINKYRTLVEDGYKKPEAAGRALGTAGNAVVFAAFTVVIALAALSVVGIPFMTIMGLTGAASIAIAAIVSLTLSPALMGLAGNYIFGKKQRAKLRSQKAHKHVVKKDTMWYRWGVAVTKMPILTVVVTVAVIAAMAWPVKDMTLGLPTDQYASEESSEKKAYDLLSEGFGVGFNSPLIVYVENMPAVGDTERNQVRATIEAEYEKQVAEQTAQQQALFEQKIAAAQTPAQMQAVQQEIATAQQNAAQQQQAAEARIDAEVENYAKFVQLTAVSDEIAKIDNVVKTQPAQVTDDGTKGVVQVIPNSSPSDPATEELIAELRSDSVQKKLSDDDVRVGVTGAAALQDDINAKLREALPVYLATIVGLSLVLLLVAFRSILVPIKATLGYVLSVLAMFGAMVAVYQWGWFGIAESTGPIVSFIPIIASGILFGLAMDYEFFLVSGMHESYQDTKDARKSVLNGFGAGAKVVVAAAIIMASVFAGFIASHEQIIQSIGFGLAVGILVDAFLVRMIIVPAVMRLLGSSAWWLPAWLNKYLPHISIEGESDDKK